MERAIRYLESLQNALHELFEQDDVILLLGEDILDPYGGAFMVAKGLSTRFPDRVLTTPICEASLVGVGTGLALRGFRPIVEIMFADFITIAADQTINHAAKYELIYAGKVKVPLVIRTPSGAGRGYGPTHSQSLEKIFLGTPNLVIVAPSHAHQPGQELANAVYDDSPTLFVENKLLYPLPLAISSEKLSIQLIKRDNDIYSTAIVKNYSSEDNEPDVTLVSYGGVSRPVLPLMERLFEEEILVNAVFPACISAPPFDILSDQVNRSRRAVLIEDGTMGFGWCSEVAQRLYTDLFGRLRAPLQCLGSEATVIPTSFELEKQIIVTESKIEKKIMEVLRW